MSSALHRKTERFTARSPAAEHQVTRIGVIAEGHHVISDALQEWVLRTKHLLRLAFYVELSLRRNCQRRIRLCEKHHGHATPDELFRHSQPLINRGLSV